MWLKEHIQDNQQHYRPMLEKKKDVCPKGLENRKINQPNKIKIKNNENRDQKF